MPFVFESGTTILPFGSGHAPQPPQIITVSVAVAMVGNAYTYQFALKGGTAPYVWSLPTASPNTGNWMSMSAAGTLTGTPGTAELESISVKVTDANNDFAVSNYSFQVEAQLLITSTSPLPSATINQAYSTTVTATGGTLPYTWSIISDVPDTGGWLNINASTGVLSGTPTTLETETLVIQVQDALGFTNQKTFTLVVSGVIVTALPVFSISATVTNASTPWTFGHAFKQGDVPSGNFVTASSNVTAFQSDPRSFWPDGSVQYAELSAISNLSANTLTSVQLSTTTTPPSGATVAEPTNLPNAFAVFTGTPGKFSIDGGAIYNSGQLIVGQSGTFFGFQSTATAFGSLTPVNDKNGETITALEYTVTGALYTIILHFSQQNLGASYFYSLSGGGITSPLLSSNATYSSSASGSNYTWSISSGTPIAWTVGNTYYVSLNQPPFSATATLNSLLPGGASRHVGWVNSTTPCLVRSILGTVKSEFHYFQPITAHLSIWWYVRAYSNGAVEIEREFSNGWFRKAGATEIDYGVSCYTTNSVTPDFSTTGISMQMFQTSASNAVYTSPSTNELLMTGALYYSHGNQSISSSVLPGTQVQYGGLTFSTVSGSQASSQPEPLYSAASNYVPGNFVASGGGPFHYQCLVANGPASSVHAPTGAASSNTWWQYLFTGGTSIYLITSGNTLPGSTTGSSSSLIVLGHMTHQKWGRVDWSSSANAPVVPVPTSAYLRATKLVPNMAFCNPGANAFANGNFSAGPLPTTINPPPFTLGNFEAGMSSGGDHSAIGILSQWDSVFVASCDTAVHRTSGYPMYYGIIGDGRAMGMWPFHVLDETTGQPINFLTAAYASLADRNWQIDGCLNTLGNPLGGSTVPGGSIPQYMEISHHWSCCYLPYLLEGRWSFLTTLQCAGSHMNGQNPSDQRTGLGAPGGFQLMLTSYHSPYEPRGAAWSWRTIAQAAMASPSFLGGVAIATADPTQSALRGSYLQSLADIALWHNGAFVAPTITGSNSSSGTLYAGNWANSVGFMGQNGGENSPAATGWWGAQWMVAYQSQVLSHVVDLNPQGLSVTALGNLIACRNQMYTGVINLIGTDPTGGTNYSTGCPYRNGIGNYYFEYLTNIPNGATAGSPYSSVVAPTGPSPGGTTTIPIFPTPNQQWLALAAAGGFNTVGWTAKPATAGNTNGDFLCNENLQTSTTAGSASDTGAGRWGTNISILSKAMDDGFAGAATAHSVVVTASNYSSAIGNDDLGNTNDGNGAPNFGFAPLTFAVGHYYPLNVAVVMNGNVYQCATAQNPSTALTAPSGTAASNIYWTYVAT